MSTTDLIIRPRPVARPALRLFVLHHAGGSHIPFRPWASLLPADWELCLIEAPGRGARPGPLAETAAGLARVFLDDLRPYTDEPYALFGHSMGAIVAYELTQALNDHGLPLPRWLGVSAISPPEHHPRATTRHDLPAAQLREAVLAMGGTPREVLEDPELWAMIEPAIRSDLRLAECWRPRSGTGPLPVPLTAFAADADPNGPADLMATWAACTTRYLGCHVLPGDHFYFLADPAALVGRIVEAVTEAERTGARLP
ncbi:thioesterase II family protein [Streptomyces orinoci]|uniref:Alpha/beta fold hydrolase n=1 Tax=Streptomyces orinoci TaxID=67339 RepID=A0A348AZ42_STRON|nr:alpha/beta fold hydrolase [Streptomyces orinoci]BBD17764.1 thioesterase [Streptomyces orinoci]